MKCQEFAIFSRNSSMYQNEIKKIPREINLRHRYFIPLVWSMRFQCKNNDEKFRVAMLNLNGKTVEFRKFL